MDTQKQIPFYHLLEKAQAKHIPIYTLGYGQSGELNEEELARLSLVSGAGKVGMGSLIRIHPRDWVAKLGQIKMNIDNMYDLSWGPTCKLPDAHVDVRIKARYKVFDEIYEKDWELDYTYPR